MAKLFKIKEIAEQKKVPFEELASSLGMSRQGLSKLIDTNSTRICTLEKICKLLDVPVSTFFDDAATKSYEHTVVSGNGCIVAQSVQGDNNFFPPAERAAMEGRIAELERQVEALKADKAFQQELIMKLMEK